MHRTTFKRLIKHRNRIISHCYFACTVVSAAFLLSSCTAEKKQHDYSIFTFGTLVEITLFNVNKQLADTAFEQLQVKFDEYHQNWSPWTNGDLAQLNKQLSHIANETGRNAAIDVPEHLIPIIKTSITLSNKSDNYFNPAIGRLINLWQFHKYQDQDIKPPDRLAILKLVDSNPQMSDLSFDHLGRLHNKNPDVLLNFGAFAKGYAIKLAIKHLTEMGIHNAIINAGGDLSVIGQHGDRAWNIGIRHPRKEGLIASIEVSGDESVFTSGDYERFYFHEGKRYHHILDPSTGYPSDGAQSVTVLHQDAGLADAAATALIVAGSKNWRTIAKKMAIEYVMLIDNDGNIYMTPAMQKRVKFLDKTSTSHIIN